MSDEHDHARTALIELTADIVSAYVSKNAVPVSALPELIESVNSSLSKIGQPPEEPKPALTPAVNPKRSVTPDYIVCLEDGQKFKSLKRHLSVRLRRGPVKTSPDGYLRSGESVAEAAQWVAASSIDALLLLQVRRRQRAMRLGQGLDPGGDRQRQTFT
ncbi:MucR family transcriptional regulator [Mesorhizobium sp. M00.F.Ca.ET.216.01.1.1]|uniref:MucR family transcriptional regulator n=1 Tax=Mesorhizobium sp. M00.F.Ca.ET.216.01.1.1 TaxID=2500528 RepID=UPI000FDCD5AD|nr:MucR family transcriptional regulator [Mesorhizobium sp. M00.F.Ca.ET.216.01.1.1]TGQ33416.1 hypothetical protein EN859_026845 [Mesorhizobium sp. M00.F.Ca.ET.216.01.1.1]